jgi:hypothetical protein
MGMWNEKVFFYIGLLMDWILSRWHRNELTLHLLFSGIGIGGERWEEFITNFISCSSSHSPTSNSISKRFLSFSLPLKDNKLVAGKRFTAASSSFPDSGFGFHLPRRWVDKVLLRRRRRILENKNTRKSFNRIDFRLFWFKESLNQKSSWILFQNLKAKTYQILKTLAEVQIKLNLQT